MTPDVLLGIAGILAAALTAVLGAIWWELRDINRRLRHNYPSKADVMLLTQDFERRISALEEEMKLWTRNLGPVPR